MIFLFYRQQYSELANDLDETKAQAHYLLLQQNSELTESVMAASKLLTHLKDFHSELLEHLNEVTHHQDTGIHNIEPKKTTRESLVCTIMNSIKKKCPHQQVNATDDWEGMKKDEDSNESFVGVAEDELELSGINPLPGGDENPVVPNVPTTDDSTTVVNQKAEEYESETLEKIEPLNQQVQDIDAVAQATVRLFRNLYKLLKDHELKLEKEM